MTHKFDVRPSPIAGRWYPADPDRLAANIDGYLAAAQLPALEGEVVAVVAPHAGYLYSGPVAGYAFAAIRNLDPELVVIVAPMHYPYSQPVLSSAHSAYATPLGQVNIDQDALLEIDKHLNEELGFGLAMISNDPEHSLEIELPFLQRSLPREFKLLPIMLRDQSQRTARVLGTALSRLLISRRSILVARTDLSHFYPQDIAKDLDGAVLHQLEAFDPCGVLKLEQEGKGFACGKGALAAVLYTAKFLGADLVKILNYATSGDVTGDFDQVVGYAAAAVMRHVTV